MYENIVFCTNLYIEKLRPKFSRPRDDLDTNITEMKAVIGILYLIDISILFLLFFLLYID